MLILSIVSPEIALAIGKLPIGLAKEENWRVADYAQLLQVLEDIAQPIKDVRFWVLDEAETKWVLPKISLGENINNFVYQRLRLLTHFQMWELKWPKSSDTRICFGPELWTYLDENGRIPEIKTKRLFRRADFFSVGENGGVNFELGDENGEPDQIDRD